MYNCKIVNNLPICRCGSRNLSGTRDYKEIIKNGQKMVLFQKVCYDCNEQVQYASVIGLDETIRYSVDDNIIEVKEESGNDELLGLE